jgi:hypothetical protein
MREAFAGSKALKRGRKGGTRMTQNVGTKERVIRIVIGVVLLALTVVGPKTWWGLVGLVPVGTALWGW